MAQQTIDSPEQQLIVASLLLVASGNITASGDITKTFWGLQGSPVFREMSRALWALHTNKLIHIDRAAKGAIRLTQRGQEKLAAIRIEK